MRYKSFGVIASIELAGPGEVSEMVFEDGSRAYIEEPELRLLRKTFGSLEGALGRTVLYATSRASKIICGLAPADTQAFDRAMRALD